MGGALLSPQDDREANGIAHDLGWIASLHRDNQSRKDALLRSTLVFVLIASDQCTDEHASYALNGLAEVLFESLGGEEVSISHEIPAYRSDWPWDPSSDLVCLEGCRRVCLRHGAMTSRVGEWLTYSLDALSIVGVEHVC